MKEVVFTSKLSANLIKCIRDFANFKKIIKKMVLVISLLNYKNQIKKKKMAGSFQKANEDMEIMQMAEENMDDYEKLDSAASIVFSIKLKTVIGPTPPGTGEIFPATFSADSK